MARAAQRQCPEAERPVAIAEGGNILPVPGCLYRGCYTRKLLLNAESIEQNLDDMAELLDILKPLTVPNNGQGIG